MTPTVEQIAKLPRWAKDLIEDQRRTIGEYVNLPEDHSVAVFLPNGEHLEFRIDESKPSVYVLAEKRLTILPSSSNAIHLIP